MATLQTPKGNLDMHFSSWRIDTNGGPPQLSLSGLSPFMMDGSTIANPRNSFSSPDLFHGNPMSPIDDQPPQYYTPTRTRSTLPTRRPPAPRTASPKLSPVVQDLSDDGSPWCGAVGRATLGKSGRVIERLMADIDKLKRELNSEVSRRQEIEKREDTNRGTMEALRTEAENLRQAEEIHASALRRRDRKIDELKMEVDAEREKRLQAEQLAKESRQDRDDAEIESRRVVGEATEKAKHASSHAEVLEHSHKQLGQEYRQRTEVLTQDLSRLARDREEEQSRVKRLDIVVEQMQQELGRSNNINNQMGAAFRAYKEGTELKISSMQLDISAQQAAEDALREETKKIVGEARWLINMGRNTNKMQCLALDANVMDKR